jgi:hypothetical protein
VKRATFHGAGRGGTPNRHQEGQDREKCRLIRSRLWCV